MKNLHNLEDISVRVMYFFNVIDTFLPFSALVFLIALQTFLPDFLPVKMLDSPWWMQTLGFIFLYFCFRVAEFHVVFLWTLPLAFFFFKDVLPSFLSELAVIGLCMFIFTSTIQVIFMGFPMGVASRSAWVPLKMFINSFIILAPTTISLPITVSFQLLMIFGLKAMDSHVSVFNGTAFGTLMLLGALTTRLYIRYAHQQPDRRHPQLKAEPPPYKRVMLLNIDGLSHYAFKNSNSTFLQHLEREFACAKNGARTVYKAFTNPAFASILTGVPPTEHGVLNNNFGQSIKTQALPDFIDTRLYGSMHVKHFSRADWNVNLVSLVQAGYDKADDLLMEQLKNDIRTYAETKFWVVDLSLVDYCGHAWGGYSKKYYEAIEQMDALIKDFFKWSEGEELFEDTLFIISSDHGLFIGEHAYMLSKKEKYVPLIFIGRNVAAGELPPDVSILDIAANVSYYLGEPYSRHCKGRVSEHINKYKGGKSFAARIGIK